MRYKENVNVMEIWFFRSHLLPALELAKPGQLVSWHAAAGEMTSENKVYVSSVKDRYYVFCETLL